MASRASTQRGLIQPDLHSTHLELQDDQEIPVPNFDKTEHLVKVLATSPCSGELYWAKNFPGTLSGGKALVPCYDLAGIVEAAPSNSPFQPGTEIWTRTTAWKTGNARQFTTATTEELSRKPASLCWEEAAATPLSGFTAYQALFEKGGLTLGWKSEEAKRSNASKRVLITAAAGGVGTIAVQLAKAAGVGSIVAQTSTENVEFVRSLGATEVVNYHTQSLSDWARSGSVKVDLAFDMLGGKTMIECFECVKDDGVVLSINDPTIATKKAPGKENVRAEFFIMESRGWQLDEIAALVERNELKPRVDSIWKLEDYEKAFAIVESGHAKGKVIMRVQ